MLIMEPDYPHIVLSFTYQNHRIEIEQGEDNNQVVYSAWANYAAGCAVAVPCAYSRAEAIRQAKRWVEHRNHGKDREDIIQQI
ncbi:MAG: hypothetical protein HC886_13260 [Leptolyngbyaceae cyanobacterium SM1_1_3]|nr:hypothetical protein [Leptolyngbyaceae cyanobacterium SM1_1_3]NJM85466.1 hypothetical protein [Leptolyngbyaceae cyanobacterium RM2_2_21]NJN02972.1 hypothetical protein [Leptolyngbyaceae cyanobacterium RM1_1_2]NJO10754.1 hypothetical protein [Leptolyngbyaceae cyanobacterium SL_1_1]